MSKKGTGDWKRPERIVAARHGRRRNPNTGEHRDDVTTARFSIQVKHGKQVPAFVKDTWEQARRDAKQKGKIPVAAFHPKGSRRYYAILSAKELATLAPDLLLEMEVGELARLEAELEGE